MGDFLSDKHSVDSFFLSLNNKFQMSSIKSNVLNVVILAEHLPVYGRSQKAENMDRGKKLKSRKA